MKTTQNQNTDSKLNARPLPSHLQKIIENCPRSGAGVHSWLFATASKLHAYRDEENIMETLEKAVAGCGRDVPQREIEDAVRNSKSAGLNGKLRSRSKYERTKSKWPKLNESLRRKAIAGSAITLEQFKASSPDSLETQEPLRFLNLLFTNNPLLCVAKSNSQFGTAHLSDLEEHLPVCSLLVPSPMTDRFGITKGGKQSMHTLNNTGVRKFLITEFDSGTFDEQASIINHLKAFAPLAMVVYSGGKSLHPWWHCRDEDEQRRKEFMRYAVTLGADHATWTRSQFVRMPAVWREDKGQFQEVVYFNAKEVQQ